MKFSAEQMRELTQKSLEERKININKALELAIPNLELRIEKAARAGFYGVKILPMNLFSRETNYLAEGLTNYDLIEPLCEYCRKTGFTVDKEPYNSVFGVSWGFKNTYECTDEQIAHPNALSFDF